LTDKALRVTVYSCANAPAGPGTPDDIAGAIAFLGSADAAFITGHTLMVDGGLTVQLQEKFGLRQAHYARNHLEIRLLG